MPRHKAGHDVQVEWELGSRRPIRLLQNPELIEAIASVPDGPPLRFRWRRVLHEVAAVEGPERIALGLWKDCAKLHPRLFPRRGSCGPSSFWRLYRDGLYR